MDSGFHGGIHVDRTEWTDCSGRSGDSAGSGGGGPGACS